ncbi:RNA polymerase subunit sigma [Stutzerimonas kirkiae]|uniref:RNA polymerase subunit sigma n=1 Tax=Stutzerimonas kirkiae TaxID=2211392 RepID=A0A4Q9R0S1_9GAMM|nr:sigma-70 family RNA polymerase sigma factor [Stutzerimonas kirkiae]TBU92179.1 RNA polymerase subunit sigma [Stutzerimonas kirkiae]TBV01159.1 RNA polymerase subunit sigma [Stutzerimonas kirkiae]TBV13982.1 RNA polymerase subunit sigma [Stutzerimonas kirkiae]
MPHSHLDQLYREHHAWLYGWLRRRLCKREDAADMAQDTFLGVLRSGQAEQLREPRAYLQTLAKRMLWDFWRRQELERNYLAALAELPETCAPSEEELALLSEAILLLDQLLGDLPDKVRHAFLLNRLEGMTHPQIAAHLGVSLSTVERWIRQALVHCYLANTQ